MDDPDRILWPDMLYRDAAGRVVGSAWPIRRLVPGPDVGERRARMDAHWREVLDRRGVARPAEQPTENRDDD